jgi:hypothetical protein
LPVSLPVLMVYSSFLIFFRCGEKCIFVPSNRFLPLWLNNMAGWVVRFVFFLNKKAGSNPAVFCDDLTKDLT